MDINTSEFRDFILICIAIVLANHLFLTPNTQRTFAGDDHSTSVGVSTERLPSSTFAASPAMVENKKAPAVIKPFRFSQAAHAPEKSNFPTPETSRVLSEKKFLRENWLPPKNSPWVTSKPLDTQKFVIMLDPGHGGSDPGALASNGLLEKNLTLDIAKRIKLYLSRYPNIEVQFTRESDTGLSRNRRIEKITRSSADIVISLHFNNLPESDVALVETFFASNQNIKESLEKLKAVSALRNNSATMPDNSNWSFTHQSRFLANTLQSRVYSSVQKTNSEAIDAGAKDNTLFVLTRSYKPGALIELTCLSNPEEAEKLESNEYRNTLAKAMAQGILEYREHSRLRRLIAPGLTDEKPALSVSDPATPSTEQRFPQSV